MTVPFSTKYAASALTVILFLWIWQKWLAFKGALSTIKDHVGFRHLTDNTSIVPGIFDFSPEKRITWQQKHQVFQKYGCDIISAVSIFPTPRVAFFVADASAAKQINLNPLRFPKRAKDYELFNFFGPNLVSSDGEQWKRHRKVTAPSYSERTNHAVWRKTCSIAEDLCDKWGAEYAVDDAVAITFSIALEVISSTGFGIPYDEEPRGTHSLSFGDALRIVAQDGFLMLVLPRAAMHLTRRTRGVARAFTEFAAYLRELIADAPSTDGDSGSAEGGGDAPADLFSSLLRSNAAEAGGSASLTDDELFGNMYLGFFAGHETTTHTLAFAMLLLAMHPDEQERLHAHILSVLPDGRMPTWQDMQRLKYVTAVVNETLRLYPPVTALPKVAKQDVFLLTDSGARVFVPAGVSVLIDIPAIHYNPKYWSNPHAFRPERFMKEWNADAFIPFGGGPRACIGRRFFETEAVAALTIIFSRYTVMRRDAHLKGAVSPFPAQAIRVLSGATLVPAPLPLIFLRR